MFAEIQRDLPWLPLIAIQDTQVCIAWIPYWYTSSKSPTLGCDVQEKDTQNMYILFRYTWCWFSSSQMLESLPYSCRFWCAQTDSKSTPVSKMSLAISFHLTFGKGTCTFPSNPSKFWVSVVPTFHAFAKEFHRRGGFTLTTLHSCDYHKYRSFEAKLQYSPETVEDLFTPSSCTWELVEKKFQVQTPSLWQLAFRIIFFVKRIFALLRLGLVIYSLVAGACLSHPPLPFNAPSMLQIKSNARFSESPSSRPTPPCFHTPTADSILQSVSASVSGVWESHAPALMPFVCA